MNEIICNECGMTIPSGAAVCPNCGCPVENNVQPNMNEPFGVQPNMTAPAQTQPGINAQPDMQPSFCSKCGTKIEIGQAFCPNCGAKAGEQKGGGKGLAVKIAVPVVVIAVIVAVCLLVLPVKVESIKVTQKNVELKASETFQLGCTLTPEKADKKLTPEWSTNNEAVATVDEKGLVTAVSDGTAEITVTAKDKSETITVMVKSGPDFKALAAELKKDGCSAEVGDDGSYMSIDTNPYDLDDHYDSKAMSGIKKANKELGFSDSVYESMLRTSSLQGRQTAEADGVKCSWTYHPNRGLEVMYEKSDK